MTQINGNGGLGGGVIPWDGQAPPRAQPGLVPPDFSKAAMAGDMPPQPQVSLHQIAAIVIYIRLLQEANGIVWREHRMGP